MFLRPRGADKRSDAAMLELARRAAASAETFLVAWRELLASARDDIDERADAPPPGTSPPPPGAGGTGAAFDRDRAMKKSAHCANHGNKGKAWRACSSGSVVHAHEAAVSLTALTPQVPSPPAEDMADVAGQKAYDLSRKVFTAERKSLRTCVGAGTLHTTYERIVGTAEAGGEDFLFNIARAIPISGAVHPLIADELIHLRALCVYKPDGSHRPLGLPESEVRFFLGCIAAQEKPAWDAFYTSPLPEAAAAQARDVERAEDRLAQARALEAQANAALTAAAAAVEAPDAPPEAFQQADDANDSHDAARAELAAAAADVAREKKPRKFPANFAFSPGGTECVSHLVDAWHETDPVAHTLSDDLCSMYNETSLRASFAALRERQPHMIPVTRLIYGRPCPIWLERTAGPLRAASVVVADTARDPHLHLPAGGWAEAGAPPPTGDDCVCACKGGHQGCPLATNQCILPYMLCLHRVQERHRDVDIVCLADDTYMHGHPAVLYAIPRVRR